MDSARLRFAYFIARDALLAERVPAGHWEGELSTSALSTATAVMALHLVRSGALHSTDSASRQNELIRGGIKWLADHKNADGGWAVGMAIGIPKRQQGKPSGPKDDLDKLVDDLDNLGL